MFRRKKSKTTQEIKTRARRTLNGNIQKNRKSYVVDTSAVISRFLTKLILRGLKGRIVISNAVMAELENLANKGNDAGFLGLEEIARLHKLKRKFPITISFEGERPKEMQIKYAKSGEIDAMIRAIAFKNKAVLITSDLVQAKSAQAYGLEVLFLRPKRIKQKRRFFLSRFIRRNRRKH
jgi:ATPase